MTPSSRATAANVLGDIESIASAAGTRTAPHSRPIRGSLQDRAGPDLRAGSVRGWGPRERRRAGWPGSNMAPHHSVANCTTTSGGGRSPNQALWCYSGVMLRAVVDTNVLFEGLTHLGPAAEVIDAWVAGEFQPCVSTAALALDVRRRSRRTAAWLRRAVASISCGGGRDSPPASPRRENRPRLKLRVQIGRGSPRRTASSAEDVPGPAVEEE
jgi:hypothetical protein